MLAIDRLESDLEEAWRRLVAERPDLSGYDGRVPYEMLSRLVIVLGTNNEIALASPADDAPGTRASDPYLSVEIWGVAGRARLAELIYGLMLELRARGLGGQRLVWAAQTPGGELIMERLRTQGKVPWAASTRAAGTMEVEQAEIVRTAMQSRGQTLGRGETLERRPTL